MYAHAVHLLVKDRVEIYGDTTLEERLEQPTRQILEWAKLWKETVKDLLMQGQDRIRMRNRDIRDFFPEEPG